VEQLNHHATGQHVLIERLYEVISGDLTLRPENLTRTSRELRAQLAAIRQQGTALMSREWPEPVT
jgi:hypothetical protein